MSRRAGNRGRTGSGPGTPATPTPPATPPGGGSSGGTPIGFFSVIKMTRGLWIKLAIICLILWVLGRFFPTSVGWGFFGLLLVLGVIGGGLWAIIRLSAGKSIGSPEGFFNALKTHKKPAIVSVGSVVLFLGFFGLSGFWQLVTDPAEFWQDETARFSSYLTGNTNTRDPERGPLAADEQEAWFNPFMISSRPDPQCAEASGYQGHTSCVNANGVPNVWVNPAAGSLSAATYWRDPNGFNASAVRVCEKHLTTEIYLGQKQDGTPIAETDRKNGRYPDGSPIVFYGTPHIDGRYLGFKTIMCNVQALGTHLLLGDARAFAAYRENQALLANNSCRPASGEHWVRWDGETCFILNPRSTSEPWNPPKGRLRVGGRVFNDPRLTTYVKTSMHAPWVVYTGQQPLYQIKVRNNTNEHVPVFVCSAAQGCG